MQDGQPLSQSGGVGLAITGGLSPGAKLRENRLFSVSETGVEFTGEMTYEQWQDGMKLLRWVKSSSTLWLADFIKRGTDLFGRERVESALVQLEFDLVDAQRAIAVNTLDRAVRQVELTTEHYWVLSKAELSPDMQVQWAALAVEHRLTALQLAKSITAGRVLTREEQARNSGRGSGLATPHGIRQTFDLWFQQVDRNDPLHTWPKERKAELYEELRPLKKLLDDLEREVAVPAGGRE